MSSLKDDGGRTVQARRPNRDGTKVKFNQTHLSRQLTRLRYFNFLHSFISHKNRLVGNGSDNPAQAYFRPMRKSPP